MAPEYSIAPMNAGDGTQTTRSDRVGLAGYGCLVALLLAGGGGGCALMLAGIGAFIGASGTEVEDTADAAGFLESLEGSVVLCGSATLALLVAVIALVILLKELGDDMAKRRRGAVG